MHGKFAALISEGCLRFHSAVDSFLLHIYIVYENGFSDLTVFRSLISWAMWVFILFSYFSLSNYKLEKGTIENGNKNVLINSVVLVF